METPVPVYINIMKSELPNHVGKLTGLNLCEIIQLDHVKLWDHNILMKFGLFGLKPESLDIIGVS